MEYRKANNRKYKLEIFRKKKLKKKWDWTKFDWTIKCLRLKLKKLNQ